MPNFSVLTNPQAASALLNLNLTNAQVAQSQERVNTGLKVGSAKDDSATFAIALGMRSDIAGFRAIRENLSLGASTLGVASAGTNQIAEQIKEIREKVIQASNNETGRPLIQTSIDNAIEQIKNFVDASRFNGINLIDGDEDNQGKSYDVVSNLVRDAQNTGTLQKISVDYQDLSIKERTRGLGALLDLSVLEGKSTETITERDDPVSTSVVFSGGSNNGEEIVFNYVDADGDKKTLTFTTYDATSSTVGVASTGAGSTAGAATFTIDTSALSVDADGDTVAETGTSALQELTTLSFSYDGDGLGATAASATAYDFDVSSVESTNASDFVAALNADSDFSQTFVATADTANNDIVITAKVTDTAAVFSSVSNDFVASANRDELAGDFALAGDDANSLAAMLETKLEAQATNGGPLSSLGFTIDGRTTAGTLNVTRDPAAGAGQLAAFTTSTDATKTFTAGEFQLTAAHGGAAQIALEFNSELDAGDTIDLTFSNNGVEKTFSLVVGTVTETGVTNGAQVPGTDTKYYITYADAIGNNITKKTPSEVADTIMQILNTTGDATTDAAGNMVYDINTFLGLTGTEKIGGNTSPEFTVTNEEGSVVITDNSQAEVNGLQVVGFNMNETTGGSLDFDELLGRVDAAENQLKSVAGLIGAAEQSLESQTTFIEHLIKAVNDGVGTLVDANMAEESARFQALQVQQQLGLQALSIANSNPQAVLSLFQ